MHRHLHYIDANLHVSRLGLAFLNQSRTIAVAPLVSADLEYGQLRAETRAHPIAFSASYIMLCNHAETSRLQTICRADVHFVVAAFAFRNPENVYIFVGVRRTLSYRGGWVVVMADVDRIPAEKAEC